MSVTSWDPVSLLVHGLRAAVILVLQDDCGNCSYLRGCRYCGFDLLLAAACVSHLHMRPHSGNVMRFNGCNGVWICLRFVSNSCFYYSQYNAVYGRMTTVYAELFSLRILSSTG